MRVVYVKIPTIFTLNEAEQVCTVCGTKMEVIGSEVVRREKQFSIMNIGRCGIRMKQAAKIVGVVLGIIVLSFSFLWCNKDIGIRIENVQWKHRI